MRSTSTQHSDAATSNAATSNAATSNAATPNTTKRCAAVAGNGRVFHASASGNGQVAHLRAAAGVAIAHARTGDHVSIYHLLQHVFHAPSAAEFQASQDAPLYEPSDRIVARCGERLLGHVHTANRVMHFAALRLPVAEINYLGVLPEFRQRGIGTALLQAAEERITEDAGQLALLRTDCPQFFARRGWLACGRHCYSTATARDILSQLAHAEPAEASPLAPVRKPLTIRLWRQVEQDAIAEMHQQNAARRHGSYQRNHAYWRWLVSRHAYERIYVAVEEGGRPHTQDDRSRIVGYAVVRGGRVLELHALPELPQAARQLLARACADAIERGESIVRLEAPPNDPLHRVVRQSGGRFRHGEADNGEVSMMKLFDPWSLLEQLRGAVFARAKTAGLALPAELGLQVESEKWQIVLTRRSAKLMAGKLGRSYLTCSRGELCRLLLGHHDAAQAVAADRIQASTRVAVELARVLLPQLPLWLPPWDRLPAE